VRASRLVSILLLLQARGRMTAAELAAELEVSERTVYRDLLDLGAAGVPLYGERGEGGGYRLLGGYRTNLTGLTPEEAETLLLTGATGPLAELGLGTLLTATRLKLLAAIPPDLRSLATRAEHRFHLDPTGWSHVKHGDKSHLRTVAGAVWRDHQLRIGYPSGEGNVARRQLDPLGLVHKTGNWYLVASSDGEMRVFRVDRIRSADELDVPAERPTGFDLASYWGQWETEYAARLPTFSTRVRLGPAADRHKDSMGMLSPRSSTESARDPDGWARQTLLFDDREWALIALQALGPEVEILEPDDLREELAARARQLFDRCRTPARLA
jgi:predicted DNA-binding transcriptional regulator YafY